MPLGVSSDRQAKVLKATLSHSLSPLFRELRRFSGGAAALRLRLRSSPHDTALLRATAEEAAAQLKGARAAAVTVVGADMRGGAESEALRHALARLRAFASSGSGGKAGEACVRLSAALSSRERVTVHRVAEQLGLMHASEGSGAARHVVLRRQQQQPQPQAATPGLSPPDLRRELSDEAKRLLRDAL